MILLVPFMPEVPKKDTPRLWPALIFVLILSTIHMFVYDIVIADRDYTDKIVLMLEPGETTFRSEIVELLKKRPLLTITPAKSDWDFKRLFFANFIHGSLSHLFLNLIGIFAGARICSSFLPFILIFIIFSIGGSLGLLSSIIVSSDISDYIPHVGASAGIFALMGSYYVFNFRFRTKYFFWVPTKHGVVALRTSWFFFIDVIVLELILSASQFFPNRVDTVDHIAHVVGFISGFIITILVKFIANWPSFIQSRNEYYVWKKLCPLDDSNFLKKSIELLSTNYYNDVMKKMLLKHISKDISKYSSDEMETIFSFISPTFIRLYPQEVANIVMRLIKNMHPIPRTWFKSLPYDSFIRIAKVLTVFANEEYVIITFIYSFCEAHPEDSRLAGKIELFKTRIFEIVSDSKFSKTILRIK